MRADGIVVTVLLLLGANTAGAQTLVETPTATVELIGLRTWTLPMLEDSLHAVDSTISLSSHACAAILRSKLGFPDAAVQVYPAVLTGAERDRIVITLLEPADSQLVRYRSPSADTMASRPAWQGPIDLFENASGEFQTAIQTSVFSRHLSPEDSAAMTPTAQQLREFVAQHRTTDDFATAVTTLTEDGNYRNRVVAVLILAGFAAEDSAWWMLTEALRDPDGRVSATAQQILGWLTQHEARPVTWAPATSTLRDLLNGTDLFAHNLVMEMLARTDVAPTLAPELLVDGGALVLAKVRARDAASRGVATAFLLQLSGRDFGDDAAAWQEWVSSLR
jgi:hypothetical protein